MQRNFVSGNAPVSDEELKKAVTKILEVLLEKNPAHQISAVKKNELIETLFLMLKNQLKLENKENYTRDDIFDRNFINKLTLTLSGTMALDTKALAETLKNVFEKKGLSLDQVAKMKPDEFKKFMQANFTADEIKLLQNALEKIRENTLQNQAKFGLELPKPRPDASKKDSEADAAKKEDNFFTHLYGLISDKTGSMQAVISDLPYGNIAGIVDLTPEGNAPIDAATSLGNTQANPAIHAATIERFMSMGDSIIDEVQEVLKHNNLNPGLQLPTLHH